jgi:hypothetical protein
MLCELLIAHAVINSHMDYTYQDVNDTVPLGDCGPCDFDRPDWFILCDTLVDPFHKGDLDAMDFKKSIKDKGRDS